jgi:hypothetical protein
MHGLHGQMRSKDISSPQYVGENRRILDADVAEVESYRWVPQAMFFSQAPFVM